MKYIHIYFKYTFHDKAKRKALDSHLGWRTSLNANLSSNPQEIFICRQKANTSQYKSHKIDILVSELKLWIFSKLLVPHVICYCIYICPEPCLNPLLRILCQTVYHHTGLKSQKQSNICSVHQLPGLNFEYLKKTTINLMAICSMLSPSTSHWSHCSSPQYFKP